MTQLQKERTTQASSTAIYTAITHTTGGRDGVSRSSDGRLDVKLSRPGLPGTGTNPEQLFAAGWSACLESSIRLAARRRKVALSELAIDTEVDLNLAGGEYFLNARFSVSLSGLDRDIAKSLVEEGERICPYSKATRGNIGVAINLV